MSYVLTMPSSSWSRPPRQHTIKALFILALLLALLVLDTVAAMSP